MVWSAASSASEVCPEIRTPNYVVLFMSFPKNSAVVSKVPTSSHLQNTAIYVIDVASSLTMIALLHSLSEGGISNDRRLRVVPLTRMGSENLT